MTKRTLFGLGLAVALVLMTGTSAKAVITGSKHDFKAAAWNKSLEICSPCHTPHGGATSANSPLWSRAATAAAFTPYGLTMNNTNVAAPTGASLLCLGCHDGTLGLEQFTDRGAPTWATFPWANTTNTLDNKALPAVGATKISATNLPNAFVGTDLRNDHPVSFLYNQAKPQLTAKTVVAGSRDLVGTLPLFGASGSGTLECGTCHDVHNNGAAGANAMLRVANTASALCLTCHTK